MLNLEEIFLSRVKMGYRKGESSLLRKLLERRFGVLPSWVEQRTEVAEEPELERWGEALLTAPSLEAIFGQ